jgi:SH3-like domain-containing protein
MKSAWKMLVLLFVVGLASIKPVGAASIFYNLKKKTEVRFSPSQESPVKFSLYRKVPVKVVRKYQDWCFIRESEGEEGWIPENMIFQGGMALLIKNAFLKKEKDLHSSNLAQLSKGLLVKLKDCQGTVCRVETKIGKKALKGWVSKETLWGAE